MWPIYITKASRYVTNNNCRVILADSTNSTTLLLTGTVILIDATFRSQGKTSFPLKNLF